MNNGEYTKPFARVSDICPPRVRGDLEPKPTNNVCLVSCVSRHTNTHPTQKTDTEVVRLCVCARACARTTVRVHANMLNTLNDSPYAYYMECVAGLRAYLCLLSGDQTRIRARARSRVFSARYSRSACAEPSNTSSSSIRSISSWWRVRNSQQYRAACAFARQHITLPYFSPGVRRTAAQSHSQARCSLVSSRCARHGWLCAHTIDRSTQQTKRQRTYGGFL